MVSCCDDANTSQLAIASQPAPVSAMSAGFQHQHEDLSFQAVLCQTKPKCTAQWKSSFSLNTLFAVKYFAVCVEYLNASGVRRKLTQSKFHSICYKIRLLLRAI